MTKHDCLTGVVLAMLACSGANRAFAQQGWTGAVDDIFASDFVVGNALAVGAEGSAVAVARTLYGALHAVRRDGATRVWEAPQLLAPAGASGELVLVGPDGDAAVLWVASTGTSPSLRVSHHDSESSHWSPPIDLVSMSRHAAVIHGAVDPSGNIVVVWAHPAAQDEYVIQASRYSGLARTWSSPVSLSPVIHSQPTARVALDPAGNAIATWSQRGIGTSLVYAARYSVARGNWDAPAQVSEAGEEAYPWDLGADAGGNFTLLWTNDRGVIRAARYLASAASWSRPQDVSAPPFSAGRARVAVGPDGAVTAVWMSRPPGLDVEYVMGARYSAGVGTWSAPVDIERRGDLAGDPQIVADRYGNVTIVWTRDTADDDLPFTHALRYTPSTGQVTPVTVLSAVEALDPRVGVDATGNLFVTWTRRRSISGVTGRIIEGTEWAASPSAPAVGSVTSGSGTLTVGVIPPATSEPSFAPTTYEYSLDDGATWTPRTPASTVSPLRISGLTNDVTYAVRLRAVNGAGPGAPSGPVAATPRPAPEPPTNLRVAAQAGNTVTVAWTAPASGMPPTAYVLEGGLQPGEVLASIPGGGPMSVPSFTFSAPTGAYYVRMHAVAGTAWSPPSNEIRLFVNVPAPPAAPTNLLGLANGPALALSWTNPPGGPAATALWLNVTGALTTTLPLPAAETFTYPDVPPGTYTFSVSASNAGGMSAPSNTVTLSFPSPCTGVPGAPTNLQVWTTGRTILLTWGAPVTGAAVTGYTVQVSGAYVGTFATPSRALSGVAASGSYTLSVVATNPCGASPATPAQSVVMP